MNALRTFQIGLLTRGLTQTEVYLEGEVIGQVNKLPHARRRRPWFGVLPSGLVVGIGYSNAEEAAFALVLHVHGQRTRDAIVKSLNPKEEA